MTDRKSLSSPWIGVAVLAVLIGGYVGAYYATVERFERDEDAFPFYSAPHLIDGSSGGFNEIAARFFSPAHWLDRRIRLGYWEPTP